MSEGAEAVGCFPNPQGKLSLSYILDCSLFRCIVITMIPRSKSAPKALSETTSSGLPPRPSRTTLPTPAATPLTSPRDLPEDPFSLTGFFPSFPAETPARGEEWDWIRSDEEEEQTYPDNIPPWGEEEGSYEEFAKQVIDGEDKLGMLAFSSENIPALLRSVFERPISPVHVSPLAVDEALDLDGVHTKVCSLRTTAASEEAEDGEIGGLFFSEEEEKEEGWRELLWWAGGVGEKGLPRGGVRAELVVCNDEEKSKASS